MEGERTAEDSSSSAASAERPNTPQPNPENNDNSESNTQNNSEQETAEEIARRTQSLSSPQDVALSIVSLPLETQVNILRSIKGWVKEELKREIDGMLVLKEAELQRQREQGPIQESQETNQQREAREAAERKQAARVREQESQSRNEQLENQEKERIKERDIKFIDDMLEKKGDIGQKIEYLEKNKEQFSEHSKQAIDEKINQLKREQSNEDNSNGSENNDNGSNDGGKPPNAQGAEYDEEGDRNELESSLDRIDREILNTVTELGEYYDKELTYRTNTNLGDNKGRHEEGYLQNRIRELQSQKEGRVHSLEEKIHALKAANDKVRSEPENIERFKEWERLLRELDLSETDKHQAEEQALQGKNTQSLEGRLREIEEESGRNTAGKNESVDRKALKDRLEINAHKINNFVVDLGGDPNRLNPSNPEHKKLIDDYNSLKKDKNDIETYIKRQNTIHHRIAELKINGDPNLGIHEDEQFKIFKDFRDRESEYFKLNDEIEKNKHGGHHESGPSRNFKKEDTFNIAYNNYEEAKGGINKDRKERYENLVESYLREANERGYFQPFIRGINEAIKDAKARALVQTGDERNIKLELPDYEKIIDYLSQALQDPKGKIQDHLETEIKEGKRRGTIDANGHIQIEEDDLDHFEGIARFWLEKAKKGYELQREGKNFIPEFKGEHNLGNQKGRFWETSFSGYYQVTAKTQEQFEQAINSFASYLTGGAVDRDPNALLRQLASFEGEFGVKAELYLDTHIARGLRHQLKAYVGFWSADYFASLANTKDYQAILNHTLNGVDGVEIMGEVMKARGGLTGLAIRLIERDRRFLPLTRYHGENGGFARTGDYEYLVREKTEMFLAEEVALYDLSDYVEGIDALYGKQKVELKQANLSELVHYQSTERFKSHFRINQRAEDIRDRLKRGDHLNAEDAEFYKNRMEQATEAVKFARLAQSALGERALKAAPSYIIEIRKQNEAGNYVDQNGIEINEKGQILINGNTITRRDFLNFIDQKRIMSEIPQGLQSIYDQEKDNEEFLKLIRVKEKNKKNLTSDEMVRYQKLKNKITKKEEKQNFWQKLFGGKSKGGADQGLKNDALVEGIGFQMERTDYVSKELAIKYMQFAENLARIMASVENQQRKKRGEDKLTAPEIARKARAFRWYARDQIKKYGLQAKILDERGNEVFFKGKAAKLIDIKNNIKQAQFLKEGNATINLESAVSITTFIHQIVRERGLTKKQYLQEKDQIETEAKAKIQELLRTDQYISVDFDGASTHVISQWNNQSYLALQHEIRSQILRPEILYAAEQIRKGEKKAEDVDILASMLLQIDPGLERLRQTSEERHDIELIHTAVEQSFQGHWRITRELDRLFIDPTTIDTKTYYGIPNERFSIKELIWNSNKIAREAQRFARRAYQLIAESPVHWSSFADTAGQDLSGVMGLFERGSWYAKQFSKEATDSNVLAGWIGDILQAYDVYVMFAKSGKPTGKNDMVTSLMVKPFNDLDKAETINDFVKAVTNPGAEIGLYNALRGLLGRAEDLLKAIEAQDNTRATKGALWLEEADIVFQDGKAYVIKYEKGKPQAPEEIADPQKMKDTGSGAHSAYNFYREYVRYASSAGRLDYPSQAWAIWMMGKPFNLKKISGFDNFWEWFGSKAIRIYPE